jgi:hypothetical protein
VTSKVPKSSYQDTDDRRKHVTLTIPQSIEIIRGLTNTSSMIVALCNVGKSNVYNVNTLNDVLEMTNNMH